MTTPDREVFAAFDADAAEIPRYSDKLEVEFLPTGVFAVGIYGKRGRFKGLIHISHEDATALADYISKEVP